MLRKAYVWFQKKVKSSGDDTFFALKKRKILYVISAVTI